MDSLYRTIDTEVQQPLVGTVCKGEVPDWINGCLYRNGPGMYEVGEHKFQHWFDGLAMIQKFHIYKGTVTYQRKFLNSDTYKKSMETNRIAFSQFATVSSPDPCQNIFRRFLTVFKPHEFSDNTLVNVFPVNRELYTVTETPYMNQIDPDSLSVVDKVNLEEKLSTTLATPHPHVEPDGTIHNLGHSFKHGLFTVLVKVPPKKEGDSEFPEGEVVCKLRSPWMFSVSYYHSFGMTENFYIFVQQSLLSNIAKILKGRVTGHSFDSSLQFYPEVKTRFRIIDRKTGQEINKKINYETDAFLLFHHINAYEQDGHIILDLCCHKDKTILDKMYMKHLTSAEAEQGFREAGPPQVRRYVLPLNVDEQKYCADINIVSMEETTAKCFMLNEKSVHCEPEVLSPVGMEFPQINYSKYNSKKYRYTYGVGVHSTENPSHTLVKIDILNKTCTEWKELYCFPSEPVFIPRPGATDEDDGVLLAAINRAGKTADSNTCFLLLLDGKTMEEKARVEFEGIDRFPRDLHGAFTQTDTAV